MGEHGHRHAEAWERAAAHLETSLQSLASQDGGIDGGEEISHRVILGHEEEVNRAVATSNMPVQADAETEDDVPHGCGCRRPCDSQSRQNIEVSKSSARGEQTPQHRGRKSVRQERCSPSSHPRSLSRSLPINTWKSNCYVVSLHT